MVNELIRQSESYAQLTLNFWWNEDANFVPVLESRLNKLLSVIDPKRVVFKKTALDNSNVPFLPIPSNYNAVIIDVEGFSRLKMLGLFTGNEAYQICFKKPYLKEFYEAIVGILQVLYARALLFGFTYFDYEAILKLKDELIGKFKWSKEKLVFVEKLRYFNIQKYENESVASALYDLGVEIKSDPLYRNNANIDRLYDDGFVDVVRQHNLVCLGANTVILLKRYLKNNLFRYQKKTQFVKKIKSK